jgi:hypothetical protein
MSATVLLDQINIIYFSVSFALQSKRRTNISDKIEKTWLAKDALW